MLKMFIRCLVFSISLVFIIINAQNNNNNINKVQRSAISMNTNNSIMSLFLFSFVDIPVAEYESSNNIANDSDNQSWQTTTERTLIR